MASAQDQGPCAPDSRAHARAVISFLLAALRGGGAAAHWPVALLIGLFQCLSQEVVTVPAGKGGVPAGAEGHLQPEASAAGRGP